MTHAKALKAEQLSQGTSEPITPVYSVTVMTHVIAFETGKSSQGTFEPITPVPKECVNMNDSASDFAHTKITLYSVQLIRCPMCPSTVMVWEGIGVSPLITVQQTAHHVRSLIMHYTNYLAPHRGRATSPPIGGGRGIVMPMSVCLFVCVCVCLSVFSQNFKV